MTESEAQLADDLIARTETAVLAVARLAVESGITFEIKDIVDVVERDLPADYPAPTTGDVTRRDLIGRMAQDILSGEIYEEP